MIMWCIHVQVLLPFLKIGENSAEFDNPVPIFQGTAWLSGVGLISHHELCLYHNQEEEYQGEQNLFTTSKYLKYPRLY